MAKFIDLSVIRSKAREELRTEKVAFNSNCIVRFFNVDEDEKKYWGYPYTMLEYTYGCTFESLRVVEPREEFIELINSH